MLPIGLGSNLSFRSFLDCLLSVLTNLVGKALPLFSEQSHETKEVLSLHVFGELKPIRDGVGLLSISQIPEGCLAISEHPFKYNLRKQVSGASIGKKTYEYSNLTRLTEV